MKILYGVQGTGNGHITRARMMAEAFTKHPIEVDYLFSGKDDDYFNMEPFGDYRSYPGLSFVAEKGQIKYFKTLKRNNLRRFYQDVRSLDVSAYDLVITDFEPISAWAAKLNKKYCIGISHQNAFRYKVPVRGSNPLARIVLKWFAPATEYLGLHWHHFDQAILPPMIKTDIKSKTPQPNKILVYLPFLDQRHYYDLFQRFPNYQFVQYHPVAQSSEHGNIVCHPLSRSGFLRDFSDCSGLICSAGFGACSEAIHYGKKLLVVPLMGQMEQLSNAEALEQLGYGQVSEQLTRKGLEQWLHRPQPARVEFPDVASEIVEWLNQGMQQSLQELTEQTWGKVGINPQN